MSFLSGISIVCFAASYAVALALEVSRLFFRLPVRLVVMLGFAAAGLFAHSVYLWLRAQSALATGNPLSSWHDWYLLAAWILAAVYFGLAASRPQTTVGLFMLPLVLVLVGVAHLFPSNVSFPRERASVIWGMIHGLMLLAGTVAVSFGFVAGVMYLIQSWRLKHRLPPQAGFKLPSLEWLQTVNKQSLVYSSILIAAGLLAGIILNATKASTAGGAVPWTDSVVVSSAALLVWLLAATIFEWWYKPAQQGRKVAYLTVASFIFLAMVMALLVVGGSEHATPRAEIRVQRSGFTVCEEEVRGQRSEVSIALISDSTSDLRPPTSDFRLPTTHHSPLAPLELAL